MSASLIFSQPILLAALALLPVFWWVLRALPPEPVLRSFPPLRLLRNLQDKTNSPQSIPLWLRLLRLLMVIAVILAASGPIWVPADKTNNDKPLLLIVDDGWASADNWPKIKAGVLAYIAQSEVSGQPVSLIFSTKTQPGNQKIEFSSPPKLRQKIKSSEPHPFAPDHGQTSKRLKDASTKVFADKDLQIVWFSDGNDYGQAKQLLLQLQEIGELQVLQASGERAIRITSLHSKTGGIEIDLTRRSANSVFSGRIFAEDQKNNILAGKDFVLAKDQRQVTVSIQLPLEVRNRIGAVRVQGIRSAAAVHLLDQSWVRPSIGVLAARSRNSDQPLLSERFYLEKALRPFAEISEINLDDDNEKLPQIMVWLDTGKLSQSAFARLSQYVEDGGFLIRFAGPLLAEHQDDLTPVALRTGGRLLGSALGWDQPQQLAEFSDDSPFFGLDSTALINVKKQVLAESVAGLSDHVWARLTDGTPLITSAKRGNGRIVLFHVTASADWSDLPLSGIFVQMLNRLLPMATKPMSEQTTDGKLTNALQLQMALGADGQLRLPDGNQDVLTIDEIAKPVSSSFPAGLWSNPQTSLARNVLDHLNLKPFPSVPASVQLRNLETTKPLQFAGWLLALAFILLILDNLAIMILAGKLPNWRNSDISKTAATLIVFTVIIGGQSLPVKAASFDPFAVIEQTRLAFVSTGNKEIDRLSAAGLTGLSRELYLRTTVEPAEPVAVDLERDDLSVISLLYWPLIEPVTLSEQAAAQINMYLKNGGMLVIDTQDGGLRAISAGGVDPALQALSMQIDIPAITKIPEDHVLTRAYYLINEFPGRYAGAPLWVEANRKGSSLDGVSSLIIGANDWAAAWAITKDGQEMAAVSGEIDSQRELSRRFGINLVMYVLAGNYKADQVHIPALLERLNQ